LIRDYRIDNGHGGLANDGDDWSPSPFASLVKRIKEFPEPDSGDGWRLLQAGEVIQEGDEFPCGNGHDWEPSVDIGCKLQERDLPYRRREQSATTKRPDIEQQVCQDILDRQKLGVAKYGRTLADNPLSLRAWLKHAYEECLDQAAYLRRAIAEIDEQERLDRDK
jgi:hypothetical protein